jgi:hypothetical protein
LSFVDATLILGNQSPCHSVLTRRKATGRIGKTAAASGRCCRPPEPPADAGARRWRPLTPILASSSRASPLPALGCSPDGLAGPVRDASCSPPATAACSTSIARIPSCHR